MIQPRNWLQQESATIPRAGGTAEGRGATKIKIQGCRRGLDPWLGLLSRSWGHGRDLGSALDDTGKKER